jgi:hypothetical protein
LTRTHTNTHTYTHTHTHIQSIRQVVNKRSDISVSNSFG